MAILNQLLDLTVTDLDAFRASTRANWPQITHIVAAPGHDFCVKAGRFKTEDVMIVEVSSTGHTIRFEDLPYVTISVPKSSTITSEAGSKSVSASANRAFYQDGSAAIFICGEDYVGYHVNFDKLALRRFFESYFGAAMPTVFRLSEPFALSHVSALVQELQALEFELRFRPERLFPEQERRVVADRFMCATLSSPLGALAEAVAGVAAKTRASASALQLAVDFVRAHYALPLTSEDIGRAATVGVRSLQLAFRGSLGTSIRQYLTMCRLEDVRRRLSIRNFSSTVTDAAYLAGFTHLGEFGVQYRARFGETPSATLRATRGLPATDAPLSGDRRLV
jgi:AraC-like DNA-binding protein